MCNMKTFIIDRGSDHEDDNDNAMPNDVDAVTEIGQTLAQIGDQLNEEALRKYKYFQLAALGLLSLATIIALSSSK